MLHALALPIGMPRHVAGAFRRASGPQRRQGRVSAVEVHRDERGDGQADGLARPAGQEADLRQPESTTGLNAQDRAFLRAIAQRPELPQGNVCQVGCPRLLLS